MNTAHMPDIVCHRGLIDSRIVKCIFNHVGNIILEYIAFGYTADRLSPDAGWIIRPMNDDEKES